MFSVYLLFSRLTVFSILKYVLIFFFFINLFVWLFFVFFLLLLLLALQSVKSGERYPKYLTSRTSNHNILVAILFFLTCCPVTSFTFCLLASLFSLFFFAYVLYCPNIHVAVELCACNHWKEWMPTYISRWTAALSSAPRVSIVASTLLLSQDSCCITSHQIVNKNTTICTTSVYISLTSCLQRRELTPNQSCQNTMTFECKYTEIILVLRLAICHTVWSSISIVEAGVLFRRSYFSELFGCDHLSDIPNF